MSLSVYMDVHVPFAITEGLRRRKIDVLRSQDDETTEVDDESLLRGQRNSVHCFSHKTRIS